MARSENKQMAVRLEPAVYKTIVERTKSGEFDNHADFIRQAIDQFLNQERLFEKLDTMQRNIMASQLDVISEVTGMTTDEKAQSSNALNNKYQDEIFD